MKNRLFATPVVKGLSLILRSPPHLPAHSVGLLVYHSNIFCRPEKGPDIFPGMYRLRGNLYGSLCDQENFDYIHGGNTRNVYFLSDIFVLNKNVEFIAFNLVSPSACKVIHVIF